MSLQRQQRYLIPVVGIAVTRVKANNNNRDAAGWVRYWFIETTIETKLARASMATAPANVI